MFVYVKHRLTMFKGIPHDRFNPQPKETEFRFNYRGQNIYQALLKKF